MSTRCPGTDNPIDCRHRTLIDVAGVDRTRDPTSPRRIVCRWCGTPLDVIVARYTDPEPDLFTREEDS